MEGLTDKIRNILKKLTVTEPPVPIEKVDIDLESSIRCLSILIV